MLLIRYIIIMIGSIMIGYQQYFKRILGGVVGLVILASGIWAFTSTNAQAGSSAKTGNVGYREILSIGCHKHDGTCYVHISGASVGVAGCTGNSVRWNVDRDYNGDYWFSLLTTAYFSGAKVQFNIDTHCYPYQRNFPTFRYGTISK